MTLVHAYRRTKVHTVELFGKKLKFEPNAEGHVVCSVEPGAALDRLLDIDEAYKVYGAEKATVAASDEDDGANKTSPYVLTQEGEGGAEVTVDLLTLTKAELLKFASDNDVVPMPSEALKKQDIADAIVAFFKVE